MLIKKVRAGTEFEIREEQCGFRQGRGCMNQVFAVMQVCEKYLANRKDVLWAVMDLETHMIRVSTCYVADTKSVWSCMKIVESSAKFFCREYGVCPGGK